MQLFNKGVGLRAGIFEFLTEFQNSLCVFAWLAVFEQGRAFFKFTNGARCGVKAQGQLFGVGTQLGQQEWIAADICRDVNGTLEKAFRVHKSVYAFVHAHQDQRNRIVCCGKNDGIGARCWDELFDRQWDRMLPFKELCILQQARFPRDVIVAVERDEVFVKKRQVCCLGRCGHVKLQCLLWGKNLMRRFSRAAAFTQVEQAYPGSLCQADRTRF